MLRIRYLLTLALFLVFCSGEIFSQEKEIIYDWEQVFYGKLNGERKLLYSKNMNYAKLSFADIDADGDLDLFLGKEDGRLSFFENRGSKFSPKFHLKTHDYKALYPSRKNPKKMILQPIDIGYNSAPTLVDIDNDQDFDLIIGGQDGALWFFENQGNNLIPEFVYKTNRFHSINKGKSLVPLAKDINLDRRPDLLLGNDSGEVWLFVNEGSLKKSLFDSRGFLIDQVKQGYNAAPSVVDFDQDGDLDLIVGKHNGLLDYYVNSGDRFAPIWRIKKRNLQYIDVGGHAAPLFEDLYDLGRKNLFIGSTKSQITYLEDKDLTSIEAEKNQDRTLWVKTDNFLDFYKFALIGDNSTFVMKDLDDSGTLDMIVGEKSGNLNLYYNKGDKKEPNWFLETENLVNMTGVKNSAPELGDLDGDGDLDLLVGQANGQIAFVKNIGTKQKARWELDDQKYVGIDVGSNSVPLLFDYDNDKDLDLFVGNYSGRVILFSNDGSTDSPNFKLRSTKYGNLTVAENSVPAFFDWNNDTIQDLIIGQKKGTLELQIAPINDQENWENKSSALLNIGSEENSFPRFVDIDDDQKLDLFIGSTGGSIQLLRNKGFQEIETEPASVVIESIIRDEIQIEEPEETENPEELITDIEEAVEEVIEEDIEPQIIIADPKFTPAGINLLNITGYRRATPTFGDLDQDGDQDLIFGTRNGKINLVFNEGTADQWEFKQLDETTIQIRGVRNTSPRLIDFDEDGDLDLFVGTKKGFLFYFENAGTPKIPSFIERKEYFKSLILGDNANPSIFDVDRDSNLDLVVGDISGKLTYLRNNNKEKGRFQIINKSFLGIDVGLSSAPLFADLNNDSIEEFLIGTDNGNLQIYQLNDSKWKINERYSKGLQLSPGVYPSAVDLDNDGDKDLILGYDAGKIVFHRNDAIIREQVNEVSSEQ